jgi:hypothetical protein
MRRVLCLLFYFGIGMAGSIMMAGFLKHGGHGVIFAGSALLAALGAYLLWTRPSLAQGTRRRGNVVM